MNTQRQANIDKHYRSIARYSLLARQANKSGRDTGHYVRSIAECLKAIENEKIDGVVS